MGLGYSGKFDVLYDVEKTSDEDGPQTLIPIVKGTNMRAEYPSKE